jgi:outer-membrane receptor for ferric coprogen and ferric-rhodotorulic acid
MWLMSAAIAATIPNVAPAQATAPAMESTRDFNIPAQPLGRALRAFAEGSGLQLVYSSALVKDLGSPGLKGSFKADDALRRLLEGTGLSFRLGSGNTVVIEKTAQEGSARVLGPVRVEGANASSGAVAGVNGSTDPTATEGTGSYTSSALSVASKMPQSMRDTPQSVSVITQERMRDQNITDFNSLMNQATGVTTVMGSNGPLNATFYSRGFTITNIQIDGGAPIATFNAAASGVYGIYPQIDMAMYDHVEILRGADGLFNGYGNPSGSVNLTRKRPLDHEQVTLEASVGSWQNYRAVLDAAAPLGFDGKLRGRGVLSYQDQDYFYDTAHNNRTLAYGILEGDLSPTTLLSGGFSLTRQESVPFTNGLPRYEDGADLNVSRSTCLCFPWNRSLVDSKELFAQLEQRISDRWSAKLSYSRIDQVKHSKYGSVSGPVNPVTGKGATLNTAVMVDYGNVENVAELTLNGSFDLFGHSQQLVVGSNFQNVDGGGYSGYGSLISSTYVSPGGTVGAPPVNVFAFDPNNPIYGEPGAVPPSTSYPINGQQQWVAYANLRLTLLDPLHFITGLRYSRFAYRQQSVSLCTKITATCPVVGQVSGTSQGRYSGNDLSWPPTYSLVYDVSKTLSAYASYTDIYQTQDRYIDHSGNSIDPVTGSNVEAGLKLEALGGKLNGSIAAYRIEQKGYAFQTDYGDYVATRGVVPDGVHLCCYINRKDETNLSRGVDAEISGEVLTGLQISAGYTWNETRRKGAYFGTNEGTPLISLAPKHLLKLWTDYRFDAGLLHRVSVGAGVNAQSASFYAGSACIAYNYGTDPSGNETATCTASANYNFTQGFYAVFAGRVAYSIDSRWTAGLNLNNLTDRRYYQTMGYSGGSNWYGEPRSVMLTMRGHF